MLLLSLSDYVNKIDEDMQPITVAKKRLFYQKVKAYNDFLRMPLTLALITSDKYFKDIKVQDDPNMKTFYAGVRAYNFYPDVDINDCFSEVFEFNGEPRFYKTISDLTKYHLELQDNLEF